MAAPTLADIKKRVMAHVGRQGQLVSAEEILWAINTAIEEVRSEMPYEAAPTITTTLVEDTYDYDIAALAFNLIHRITMSDSDLTTFPAENIIPSHYYYFVPVGHLVFDEAYFYPIAGRKLKIEGQKFQAPVAADADAVNISPAFVALQAAASLVDSFGNLPQRTASLYRRAEEARLSSPNRPRPGTKIVWGV